MSSKTKWSDFLITVLYPPYIRHLKLNKITPKYQTLTKLLILLVIVLVYTGLILLINDFRLENKKSLLTSESQETSSSEKATYSDWKTRESNGFLVSYPPNWKFEFIDRSNGSEFDDMSEVKVSNPNVGSVSFYNFVTHGPMGEFNDTSVIFGGHLITASERVNSSDETWTLFGDLELNESRVPIFIASLNEKGRPPTAEEREIIRKIVSEVKFK